MSWNISGISLQLQRPDLFWLKRCHRLSCPCLCRLDAFDFLCSHKLFFSAAAERESFSDPQRVTLLKKGRSCCHRKAFLTPWLWLRQPQDSVTLAPIRASYTSSHFLTKKKKTNKRNETSPCNKIGQEKKNATLLKQWFLKASIASRSRKEMVSKEYMILHHHITFAWSVFLGVFIGRVMEDCSDPESSIHLEVLDLRASDVHWCQTVWKSNKW